MWCTSFNDLGKSKIYLFSISHHQLFLNRITIDMIFISLKRIDISNSITCCFSIFIQSERQRKPTNQFLFQHLRIDCEKCSGHHWENVLSFITNRFIEYQVPVDWNKIFKVKRLSTRHFDSNELDSAARMICTSSV